MASESYHHGDLPAALLEAVDEIVREGGVGAVSLREAARRVGVTHSAPAHHFGDKAGLLTAFAAEGFRLLRDHLAAAVPPQVEPDRFDFTQVGLAYVEFAATHPAHFAVMFRPEHVHEEDEDYLREAVEAFTVLLDAVRILRDDLEADDPRILDAATGAWSLVHGFATLWLEGTLSRLARADRARDAAAVAFAAFAETMSRALESGDRP